MHTKASAWTSFRGDLERYSWRSWLSDRTIYAVAWMRVGQAVEQIAPGLVRSLARQAHESIGMFVRAFTGIEIGRSATIGAGFRIFHGQGVVIHPAATIGRNCSLMHGVTLGTRRSVGDAPSVGDDVAIGAGAVLLGAVSVGDGASVGANAVVVRDVEPGVSVAGNPARPVGSLT